MLSLSFLVPLRKANAEQLLFTSIITQNFAESRIRADFFAVKMQDVNVHRGFRTKKVAKYVRLPNRFGATYPTVVRKICVFMEKYSYDRMSPALKRRYGDVETDAQIRCKMRSPSPKKQSKSALDAAQNREMHKYEYQAGKIA